MGTNLGWNWSCVLPLDILHQNLCIWISNEIRRQKWPGVCPQRVLFPHIIDWFSHGHCSSRMFSHQTRWNHPSKYFNYQASKGARPFSLSKHQFHFKIVTCVFASHKFAPQLHAAKYYVTLDPFILWQFKLIGTYDKICKISISTNWIEFHIKFGSLKV